MSWLSSLLSLPSSLFSLPSSPSPPPVAFAEAAPKPELRQIATLRTDFLRRYSFGDLLEPEDDILQTKGGGSWDIYDRIASDDQVFACFQQRRLAVVSCEWEVVPGDDRRASQKAADFLRETLDNLQWDSTTDKMLWGVFYGKAVAECMWNRDGSFIHLASLQVKPQRRFRFTLDKELRLLTSEQPVAGLALPDRKFWHFSTGANHDDAPDGLALAHYLYWLVLFKSNDLKFWLTYADQFGNPSKIGKYPPGSTKTEQDKLLQALQALSQDTGIIIPEGMVIELLEAQRTGSSDLYDKLHEKMNSAIAKVVLSQTMTTDNGSSKSQAEVHAGVKAEIVKADADLVCSSFNRTVVPWLIRDFNGANFPGAALPKVWRRLDSPPDLKALAERDRVLSDLGFPPSPEYILQTYGEGFVAPGTESAGLNGIQVQSLLTVIQTAASGGIAPEAAIKILEIAFPGIDAATATQIIGSTPPSPSTPDPSTPPPPTASLDDVAALFAEGTLEFAGAAPGKKKNCTKGISCGGSCISASKTCKKALTPEQQQQVPPAREEVRQPEAAPPPAPPPTPEPTPTPEPAPAPPRQRNPRTESGDFPPLLTSAAKVPKSTKEEFAVGADQVEVVALKSWQEFAGKKVYHHGIAFQVNGEYDRLDTRDPRQGFKIARAIDKHFKDKFANYPDGVLIECTAYSGDDAGDSRERLYQKAGFSQPEGVFDTMRAITKNGKLMPITETQLEQLVRSGAAKKRRR